MGQETPTEKHHFFGFRKHGKDSADSHEAQSNQAPHDKERSPAWPSWLGGHSRSSTSHSKDGQKARAEVKESEGGRVALTTVQVSIQKDEHKTESQGSQPPAPVLREDPKDESANTSKRADAVTVDQAIGNAQKGVDKLNLIPGLAQGAANTVGMASTAMNKIDSVDSYLAPLKIFNSVITTIAGLHPYAAVALAALTTASNLILAQANLDAAIHDLLAKVSNVYQFLLGDGVLARVTSMKDTLAQTAQIMHECSQFISNYSETKNFWIRLGKNVLTETTTAVTRYNDALDGVMQRFRDVAVRDILEDVGRIGDDLQLDGLAYAAGAGLNTTKKCLEGTRTEILSEIVDWINSPEVDSPRVFWLFGQAGTGKSSIAHTVAMRFKDLGRLGSCFCFARDRQTERRHEKMFTTIARDMAGRDLLFRAALAGAIVSDPSLRTTPDVTQQWEKLIREPLSKVTDTALGNVLIVIDGLDESGGEASREYILKILASAQAEGFPSSIRIFISSRPLPDIQTALSGSSHVKLRPMDTIPPESTERDIRMYISEKLRNLGDDFNDEDVTHLAQKSDGLFEWSRLACEFIRSYKAGVTPKERFEDLISLTPGAGKPLLDEMYRVILADIMDDSPKALARFHSVMRQIMWTLEPLSLASLNTMRRAFIDRTDRFKVEVILTSMASLFSGIADTSIPVRPLHSSFYDFLTDEKRSEKFHVDASNVHANLATGSLHVMQEGLRFNICKLESSYKRNSEISHLAERIKECIPDHLSYSCRFWHTHVKETKFDAHLAAEVKALLANERILFWLEALGLLDALSNVPEALTAVLGWLDGHDGYEDAVAVARDTIKFVRRFSSTIVQSTPHLYLSALPFSPANSVLATRFAKKFTRLPHLARGRDLDWSNVQIVMEGHTSYVWCVAFSPDGKRIVSGSDDLTVRIWDAETGLQVGKDLDGHTDTVLCVAFSPDGKLLASSSDDKTIRLWDAATGDQRGKPFEGHKGGVMWVSFSPDGRLLASASSDKTVCVWDLEAGTRLGPPYEGHTEDIYSAIFSPDGKRILSGSDDSTIRIWDVENGSHVATLEGHTGGVYGVAFSLDGKLIASASEDETIRLWNGETYAQVGEPLEGHTDAVQCITFSPGNRRIASGSEDGTIRLWDTETGKQVGNSFVGHTDAVQSVAFSPDGKRIVSGSDDFTIRVWDVESGLQVGSFTEGHSGVSFPVTVSPDGLQILSTPGDDTICLWDSKTGVQIGSAFRGHTEPVNAIAFSPDGNQIASGSADGTVRLWNVKDGTSIGAPFEGHTDGVRCVVFSPDGTRLASSSFDSTIRMWDVATGKAIGTPFKGHTECVCGVAFSPDGKRLVSCAHDSTLRIWDVETGSQVGSPLKSDGWNCGVAFAPDGKTIASGSDDDYVFIWDAETQTKLRALEGHIHWVKTVAFSPDGTQIASGSDDHTIRLWDSQTGASIGDPLKGHTSGVESVVFSPDGKHIISSARDCTVRVWDLEDCPVHGPTELISFPPENMDTTHKLHPDPLNAISPDNSCNDTKHVKKYPVYFSFTPDHALRDAEKLFDGVGDVKDWRDMIRVEPDGWIVGPQKRLLLWVPLTYRSSLRLLRNTLMIPKGGMELDLSDMAHGDVWQECFVE